MSIGFALLLVSVSWLLAACNPGRAAPAVRRGQSLQTENWAGWLTPDRHKHTTVIAQWKQPSVKCPSRNHAQVVVWAALGGWSATKKELVQGGGIAFCQGRSQVGSLLFDHVPNSAKFSTYEHVKPGDTIKSVVTKSDAAHYTVKVTATRDGAVVDRLVRTFSTVLVDTAAECMIERAAEFGAARHQFIPFSNFSRVAFSRCETVGSSSSTPVSAQRGALRMNMIEQPGGVIARTEPAGERGRFGVVRVGAR